MPSRSIDMEAVKAAKDVRDGLPTFFVAVLLLFTLAAACAEPDPRLHRLFSRQVKQADLPSEWFVDGAGVDDRDQPDRGILARWIQFRGVPESVFPTVLVTQWLVDYPDTEQAMAAYAEEERKQFPVQDWTWPEQTQIQSKADEFRLACLERNIEIHSDFDERYRGSYFCRVVGRYGTTVSIIYANVFQDQWLTFADLQHLLEVSDVRLASGQP